MTQQRSQADDRFEQQFTQGANPVPTRAPLERREASPSKYYTSGMEHALGALADKTHKPK